MKKYLMTLLTLGLACNAAACMEDEPFYDTEIPPHASIDNSKGEGVTRLVTYNVGIFNKYIKDDYQLIADMMKEIDADAICMNELDNNTNRTRPRLPAQAFRIPDGAAGTSNTVRPCPTTEANTATPCCRNTRL